MGQEIRLSFIFSVILIISSSLSSSASSMSSSPNQLKKLTEKRFQYYQTQQSYYDQQFLGYQQYYHSSHQSPVVKLSPHRTGIRGLSSIINDQYSLIMCTVPKVGSSTWRKFMLYLDFPYLATTDGLEKYSQRYGVSAPDAHNISKNGVKLMALQSPSVALDYYNNPKYLKVFHIRNPITRVLSAWLSKNAWSSNPLPFAMYSPTFEIFIQVSHSISSFSPLGGLATHPFRIFCFPESHQNEC
jgi:hypothetical protein